MENFLIQYKMIKNLFEKFFKEEIFELIQKDFHPKLAEACIYSLDAGGKRIRPILAISASQFDITNFSRDSFLIASSLECIHTYSLIHDDLPAMDNDDFRRGIPTCHKKFSESTAILAGDALNSFAYYLLSKMERKDLINKLIQLLHDGSGGSGMISGQLEDLELENNPDFFSEQALNTIHSKKTGALIHSSLLMGNLLHEDSSSTEVIFSEYGTKLGLLFQITDDIIDVEGNFEEIGKTPGKDSKNNKLTYISLYGLDKSKKIRDELTENLISIGTKLVNYKTSFFTKLPLYIATRKN
jgi:geranylgeranyl diphosphate synthase type II